jgi:hypothetical protein
VTRSLGDTEGDSIGVTGLALVGLRWGGTGSILALPLVVGALLLLLSEEEPERGGGECVGGVIMGIGNELGPSALAPERSQCEGVPVGEWLADGLDDSFIANGALCGLTA